MDQRGEGATRRLRVLDPEAAVDAAAIGAALATAVEASPRGMAPRALRAAVAQELGVAVERIGERELTAALGVAIATGRVDESGGRLRAVPQERREAG